MATKKKLLQAAAGNAVGGFTAIEDVFSTYLYTGNGSTQTITNGIDLAGEGGLVWTKGRSAAESHFLFDTVRGLGSAGYLQTNNTNAANTYNDSSFRLTSYNSDGFSLAQLEPNNNGVTYASWTFRKAPRFFDVVTYTGNGTTQAINHNLGSVPGVIITKRTDSADDWTVYHRSEGATRYGFLHLTNAFATASTRWNNTEPTDTQFFLGNDGATNGSGGSFVAYLFAHDPLGPSGDGSDGLIACGSYTGNGSANGPEINLGWEPQWLLVKRSDSAENWFMLDIMRGITTGGADPWLNPNTSGAEFITTDDYVDVTATGFKLKRSTGEFNANGGTYIYIAIRRGPMRPPESGTEVFSVQGTSTDNAPRTWTPNFPVDMSLICWRNTYTSNKYIGARMTGNTKYMVTNGTGAENTSTVWGYDANTGEFGEQVLGNPAGVPMIHWMFRRAPEFFDVVAYTGDGVAGRTVPHNLGVAPELMIVKNRSASAEWDGYHIDVGPTKTVQLSTRAAPVTAINTWNSTTPTADVFTVGSGSANTSGNNYIAYLFASKAGVSKVGSYTGNGSSQTIDCGFTAGARFVLVKKVDNIGTSPDGSWYVWDTARGIVAGNDPYLALNLTSAEITSEDAVDPASVGFVVNQVAATNINVNAASYIFLAIA